MRVQHLNHSFAWSIVVVAGMGHSQHLKALQLEAAPEKVHTEARRTLGSPTVPTVGAVVGSSVLLLATKEEKTAKATLGMSLPAGDGRELNLFVRASGPLDENAPSDAAVLGDLDGLRRATEAALGINLISWDPSSDAKKQAEFCRTVFSERLPEAAEKLLAGLSATAREERRKAIVDSLVRHQCARHNIPEERRMAFDKAGETRWGTPVLVGLTFEIGRQDVRYLDSTGSAFAKERQSPLAATIAAGLYKPAWRTFFVFGLRAERSFEAGSAVQYCVSTGQGATLECRTFPRQRLLVAIPLLVG